ncbi:LysR family transcriptional regulator [Xinfangfangia sp. D13-10-4-6]|uniref:LysR family transcriptional regulator n=1 Tax=Pseudogemmobacter hezensis TaxID=2737662 RepID=UPI001552523B|nr:LysR family transcriptional regulator [Pseudogemmobacter hezensis]NPD14753.1 LysR family transcriptional regulator [Pseudogemmobacter hezensis]
MRSSTLILAGLVMRHGGVRAAARAMGQPVSSASTAIARLEDALGVVLLRRTEEGLALTLEGRRCRPAIQRIADLMQQIHAGAFGNMGNRDSVPKASVGIEALFRLAEVLRTGSIRRAALVLGIGQPQLTRQVALIERSLGVSVAQRSASGLVPTPEGQRLLSQIARLQDEWRSLTASLKPETGRPASLGAMIPASADGDLSRMLARLGAGLHLRHGLRFSLVSTLAEDLLLGLDSGRFDCVFLDARLREAAYIQAEVMRGPVALYGRALAAARPTREGLQKLLRHTPLVLQSRRSGLRQRAEAYFEARIGQDWRKSARLIEVESLPVIVSMVQNEGMLSVLPAHLSPHLHDLPSFALPPDLDQRVLLTWRRGARATRIADLVLRELGCAPPGPA